MNVRIGALLTAAAILVAACGGGVAAPSPAASGTSKKDVKAQVFVFSNSSPNVTVIDGETFRVLRTKDLPNFKSWTWNDDNNYFDGQNLWLGHRDPQTNDAEVILLNLDTLEVTDRVAVGK